MMKGIALLLTIVILLTGQRADAAKCKYALNSVDKFTNALTVQTKWNALTSSWLRNFRLYEAHISVKSEDGDTRLFMKIGYYKETTDEPSSKSLQDFFVFPEYGALLIRMSDGTFTELPAIGEVRENAWAIAPEDQDRDTDKYSTVASAVVAYTLNESAMQALTAQPATKVTMTTAGDPVEVEIHKKSFGDFVNDVGCIIEAEGTR